MEIDERMIKKLESAIEAILFTMGESVELKKIADAINHDEDTTRKIIKNMMDKYLAEDRGITIVELNDSYQMCTKAEMYDYIAKVAAQPRDYVLTDVQLETLSIVAYKQPITKGEISKIRGVNCDHAINRLVEVGLVEERGRLNAPGRPLTFGTTEEFLRRFGLSSVEELPIVNSERIEDFKREAVDEIEGQIKFDL